MKKLYSAASRAGSLYAIALLLSLTSTTLLAQTSGQAPVPAAPNAAAVANQPAQAPAQPVTLPKPNPANFTATSPTQETVNAFLKQLWGYDPTRVWQVEAIQKTAAPDVSRVTVYVMQQGSTEKPQATQFFVLPDGKHALAGDVIPFGPTPFAEDRELMRARANGPSMGAASKDLEIVEFSDFQCPHCKDAQPNIQKLLKDFPNAHFVYENYPLVNLHPAALQAAEYGVCVAKQSSDAFFKYADAVFASQDKLTPAETTQTLKDAVTKAGANPDQVAACAMAPDTKAAVDASTKLAQDANVSQTPTLLINGFAVPAGGVPYQVLHDITAFRASMDGVAGAPPSLSSIGK